MNFMMKRNNGMKVIKILALFLLVITIADAQEDQLKRSGINYPESFSMVPPEIKEKCSRFFDIVMNNEYQKAFEMLLKNSPIIKKSDDLANLVKQTERAARMYGEMKGYEPVSAEKATDSYIRVRYLGIHPDMPMRWIITFYKSPKRGWMVSNVRFDDLTDYFFSDE